MPPPGFCSCVNVIWGEICLCVTRLGFSASRNSGMASSATNARHGGQHLSSETLVEPCNEGTQSECKELLVCRPGELHSEEVADQSEVDDRSEDRTNYQAALDPDETSEMCHCPTPWSARRPRSSKRIP